MSQKAFLSSNSTDQASVSVVLVHIEFSGQKSGPDFDELKELALTAAFSLSGELKCKRNYPDAKYFIGSGKLAELKLIQQATEAPLIIFNHDLSPTQERNLAQELECVVMSRTGLILEIFSQRARTHEGKLQVELAQLEYQASRLVRGWTHLERQRGGIGLRGGPGETQLEIDKRLLRKRIKQIKAELEKVKAQRLLGRNARKKSSVPTISLIGYTNAGKSTLFNLLSQADVYVANQLFATLDPTIRKLTIPYFGSAYLIDTVGFIRDLPHSLVDAFHATLEETLAADLLLHVIDAASPEYQEQRHQVAQVLTEINVAHKPILEVMNKIDLIPGQNPEIKRDREGLPEQVWISALGDKGQDFLWQALAEKLGGVLQKMELKLSVSEGALYTRLKRLKAIQDERIDADGLMHLTVRASPYLLERLVT